MCHFHCTRQKASPMKLPQRMPLPVRKSATQRNTLRSVRLSIPCALRIPIIWVRSRMMMSSPLIIVKAATTAISIRMTHTLVSSRASQAKTVGFSSSMVCTYTCTPWRSTRFSWLMSQAASSIWSKSFSVSDTALYMSSSQPLTCCSSAIEPSTICWSISEKCVSKISLTVSFLTFTFVFSAPRAKGSASLSACTK